MFVPIRGLNRALVFGDAHSRESIGRWFAVRNRIRHSRLRLMGTGKLHVPLPEWLHYKDKKINIQE